MISDNCGGAADRESLSFSAKSLGITEVGSVSVSLAEESVISDNCGGVADRESLPISAKSLGITEVDSLKLLFSSFDLDSVDVFCGLSGCCSIGCNTVDGDACVTGSGEELDLGEPVACKEKSSGGFPSKRTSGGSPRCANWRVSSRGATSGGSVIVLVSCLRS